MSPTYPTSTHVAPVICSALSRLSSFISDIMRAWIPLQTLDRLTSIWGLNGLLKSSIVLCNLLLNVLMPSCSVHEPVSTTGAVFVNLNLTTAYNLKAASTGPADPLANFDGYKRAYPVEWLPSGDTYSYTGVQFSLPPFQDPHAFDVVGANSQEIPVPTGYYQSFHSLITWTGDHAQAADISFNFIDGSSEITGIMVSPWWSTTPFDCVIRTPFHYSNPSLDTNMTISYNVTGIHYSSVRISNNKKLVSITLPPAEKSVRVFSISLLPLPRDFSSEQTLLRVENVRSTTKWIDSKTSNPMMRVQQVEVTIGNIALLSAGVQFWITSQVSVRLLSNSIDTIVPGTIKRLRSNDQVVVTVGVLNKEGVEVGSDASVKVMVDDEDGKEMALLNWDIDWNVTAGIPRWKANDESMATHEAPDWYDDAKFGIFIHYGLYSVPAWAPTGWQYVAWYDWDLHNPPNSHSPTWVRHRKLYGENFTYDDFLADWTASLWNPDDWTDFFASTGAKYFVFVTKHHDGILLYDTNSTDRTTIKLGPKRNFLAELFASAKSRHPEMRRGTYFSLPEWFNPAYQPHGKPSFPGGLSVNPYTSKCCDPFIGYKPINDFLLEIQKPQMETLFYEYDTEMLWCDIGFDSVFPQIGADWYNYAASQGRQVVMNNRCGANQSDFVTPEYATFSSILRQKWESSAGMDPYSYAFNSDTPLENYKNASTVLHQLIDIVSKGGNYLIGVGPKEDTTIIVQMTQPLLDVGAWLRKSGEAIYGTRPWWLQQEDSAMTNVRFTTTPDAFYILAISRPSSGKLKVTAPVPIVPGDRITLLGGSGTALNWTVDGGGVLTVEVSDEELDRVSLPAWAFKVPYSDT